MQKYNTQLKLKNAVTEEKVNTISIYNPTVKEVTDSADILFLGVAGTKKEAWLADINMRGNKVMFNLDSGADVTAVSEQTFENYIWIRAIEKRIEASGHALTV